MHACDEYLELISGGADSELNGHDAARLFEHLEACDGCKALYEFYVSMNGALSLMEEPPAKLAEGVMLSVKNKKKRGGLRGRFAFRSFTAVAAAIAVVILITSYKGGFIPHNSGISPAGGSAPPPAAAPQAAMSAAAPEIAMFGSDTGGNENEIAEYGSGNDAVRVEAKENQEPRIMATSAPADTEDMILFSASPEVPAADGAYTTALRDVLSEHSGEFSKVMLFYEKAPVGIAEAKTFKTPLGTVCHVLPVKSFSEIEALNTAESIEFSIIDDDPGLDAKASDFVIIIYE